MAGPHRFWRPRLLLGGACLLTLLVTRDTWLREAGEILIHNEPPCHADMIVVLAGDGTGCRLTKAAELARDGWAPKILVSGAGELYERNEGDLAIDYGVRHGFPREEFINFPSPAHSTVAEAGYIVRELHRRHVSRFLLVTSDYHTARSARIFRKQAPDLPFCVVAAPDKTFHAANWWHDREAEKIVFNEWVKTIANVFGI